MPKVSVIVPCYNLGQFLNDAVDSVLSQTYPDFEIIVVNDGSTDQDTLRLLENYNRPHTRVIHTVNQGLAAARNNGIREARGIYILPLDADDRICPTYMEKAVSILDEQANVGIVYCEAMFFGEKTGRWELQPYQLSSILVQNMIFSAAFFRKSDWVSAGGYKSRMIYGWEDYDLWLSLIELGRDVYQIPEILFQYRIRLESMVNTMLPEQYVYSYMELFNNHRDLYTNNMQLVFQHLCELTDKSDRLDRVNLTLRSEVENLRSEVDSSPSKLQGLRQLSKVEAIQTLRTHGTRTISIVIAVYYNELSLPHLFEALLNIESSLIEKNVKMELIFVDDGSGDGSLDELLKIKKRRESTKVIKLTKNFGAVHASKTGLQFVTGDCFLVLAADLQDPPELIPMMVDKWLQGSKFILCKRTNRHDPVSSKLFAYIYYKLVRFFVVKDYPRSGYDLALMDSALLPYLQNSSKNINPPLFAFWLGFQPEVILYERQKRVHGKSRWTFSKKLKLFLDSLLGFSVVPVRLISLIGLFVSLASFGYGTLILINALRGKAIVLGFATIVTILSLLLGLIIIMLGVIGEYVWRIFDEINKRPESVIDEIY